MGYPIPSRFIDYVANKSRCAFAAEDATVEVALDWLREQILDKRAKLDDYYEQQDARCVGDDGPT